MATVTLAGCYLTARSVCTKQFSSQLLHQLNALQTVNGASELNGEPSKLEAQYAAHMQAVPPLPNINGSTQVVRFCVEIGACETVIADSGQHFGVLRCANVKEKVFAAAPE